MLTRSVLAVTAVLLLVLVSLQVRRVMGGDVIKAPTVAPVAPGTTTQPTSPLDFVVKDIDGKEAKLSDYRGKVVMIVNVASQCGNTPQYKALESLYTKYKDQGLVIVGFPANDFGSQEPGSDPEIKEFCTSTYKVTFPMMSKISVKGDDMAPLYKFLTAKETAGDFSGDIEWNFTKFLVDRNGNLMARIFNRTKPDDKKVVDAIEKALAAK